jgi:hypothetical protein
MQELSHIFTFEEMLFLPGLLGALSLLCFLQSENRFHIMMVILWGFGAYEMLPNSLGIGVGCLFMLSIHGYKSLSYQVHKVSL